MTAGVVGIERISVGTAGGRSEIKGDWGKGENQKELFFL
jgi:hypothetical protein